VFQSVATGRAVAISEYAAHNVLLGGGHIDAWTLIFDEVKEGDVDPSMFTVEDPDSCIEMVTDDDAGGPTLSHPKHNLEMVHPEHEEVRQTVYKNWAATHEKETTPERAAVFHNNLRFINAHNHMGKGYKVGVNHMADLTRDERKRLNGYRHAFGTEHKANLGTFEATMKADDLPDQVDWLPYTSRVLDQGACGSCWAFSAAQAVESQYAIVNGGSVTELSAQEIMDCDWGSLTGAGDHACDGGNSNTAIDYLVAHNGGGLATTATYPYDNNDGVCRSKNDDVDHLYGIQGYMNITSGDWDSFNEALATKGPLSIAINAADDSFYFFTGEGVYHDEGCVGGYDDLDHAVLAVGYEEDETYGRVTLVKNSWSTHWADDGYVRIAQDGNICGVSTDAIVPVLEKQS